MIDNLTKYLVLRDVIESLWDEVRPTATGHIRTAISVLSHRLSSLEEQLSPEELTYVTLANKKINAEHE